jgi:hypothetical protein
MNRDGATQRVLLHVRCLGVQYRYFFAHEQEDLMLLGPVSGVAATVIGGLKDAMTKEDGISEESGWVRK